MSARNDRIALVMGLLCLTLAIASFALDRPMKPGLSAGGYGPWFWAAAAVVFFVVGLYLRSAHARRRSSGEG